MKTKKIEIEVPEGKTAKWIDGVLKLVDDEPKDTRPVTERVKTFEDACKELGYNHALVEQWVGFENSVMQYVDNTGSDIISYMKLRIICAALNEGWEPQFMDGETRYYPWLCLYTKDEVDKMDEDNRNKLVLLGGSANFAASCGITSAYSSSDWSCSYMNVGSRLCLKSEELAIYCGNQFIDIWADYYLIKK